MRNIVFHRHVVGVHDPTDVIGVFLVSAGELSGDLSEREREGESRRRVECFTQQVMGEPKYCCVVTMPAKTKIIVTV